MYFDGAVTTLRHMTTLLLALLVIVGYRYFIYQTCSSKHILLIHNVTFTTLLLRRYIYLTINFWDCIIINIINIINMLL